jgi:hypothetical protein
MSGAETITQEGPVESVAIDWRQDVQLLTAGAVQEKNKRAPSSAPPRPWHATELWLPDPPKQAHHPWLHTGKSPAHILTDLRRWTRVSR